MIHFIRSVFALLILGAAVPANAALKILATTADWGALATELGGDRVNVYTATSALQDVHRVDAKPSLVARARTADLLIAKGAELEVGWLPVLVQESGNSRIQRGQPGYFEAASQVKLLEVPSQLDRSLGDIHPQGNPHVQLDPHNIAAVAKALTQRLVAARSWAGAVLRTARQRSSMTRWQEAIGRWESKAAPLKGAPGGHHASRPGVSLSLAGTAGARGDRAKARRAAQRGLPRRTGDETLVIAASHDHAQCVQRSEGGELALRTHSCAGRGPAVLGRRYARSEGSVRHSSMTRSIDCWR